ncbi:Pyrimidine pathway regulatory protein 1 [Colletotrichum gloeosporioides]|uniref:Pyrimidine pathway regulatory protein 1 n=1 Tax=Colletotrichum gloeosporioides TaxID=474922 RepID=A0A8H4CXX5_COLGL|nr:Pyrimidine pathway regulatory protein 1 [Colletotrichum gloeosporioides]KAF3812185.1 Pyrimidine pathway regulatory protein 1 [Colletotrichum gloeosporioides]
MAEDTTADTASPSSSPAQADNIPTPNSNTRTRSTTHRRGLKRGVAACERCRRRKQKCDGQLPICGQCSAAGTPCVPSERFLVRVANVDCECDRLRSQVENLTAQLEALMAAVANGDVATDSLHPPTANSLDTGTGQHASQRGHALERIHTDRLLRPTFSGAATSRTGEESLLNSPSRLWDGVSTGRTPEGPVSLIHPSLQDNNYLIEGFFSRRWPQFPALHKPTFLEKHYLPFSQGEAVDDLSLFQVNIVLAIAASERARTDERHRQLQDDFFQSATASLGGALATDDFDSVQCLLLLCIYGNNEPQSVNLWYAIGLALRLAVGMNLHRVETIASKEALEAEMCKRLFWCVYTMDRGISMSLGLPLGIQDADITMPLPLSLSDDVLANPSQETPLSFGPDVNDLSTFLHIIELRRINADIYKSLHSAGDTNLAGSNIDVIRVQHHTRLNQWLVSAPRYLVPTSMHQTPEWFQIAYHQAIMNLYRPSHASPVSTIEALRHCADSSISLISCYAALYAKNKVTYTFVALTSLFMAGVTMLYSLRASAALRQELTRDVVESNIRSCTTLLRDISHGGAVVERSVGIIQRLGRATLPFFESNLDPADNQVDTEFMSWFGLKGHHPTGHSSAQPTPSADIPWNDLFEHGFDLGNIYCGDVLI